jgi:hypothetical protein
MLPPLLFAFLGFLDLWGRAGAVENRDDDDYCDCVCRQSLYEAAIATSVFVALPVSSSNLISIALGNGGLPLLMKLE